MKVPFQGREIEVQEVDTVTSNEQWNEYQLTDGTVLLIKIVLVRIRKALTEKNDSGDPIVLVDTQVIVRTK